MPRYQYDVLTKRWYKALQFETSPAYPTEGREEVQTDARIRIHQDRRINNHSVVVLANVDRVEETTETYEVTRAYHGRDEDSGELITDLTLKKVRPNPGRKAE